MQKRHAILDTIIKKLEKIDERALNAYFDDWEEVVDSFTLEGNIWEGNWNYNT